MALPWIQLTAQPCPEVSKITTHANITFIGQENARSIEVSKELILLHSVGCIVLYRTSVLDLSLEGKHRSIWKEAENKFHTFQLWKYSSVGVCVEKEAGSWTPAASQKLFRGWDPLFQQNHVDFCLWCGFSSPFLSCFPFCDIFLLLWKTNQKELKKGLHFACLQENYCGALFNGCFVWPFLGIFV